MKLIVGLGNPGKKYSATRHNIGFQIIDLIQKESDFNFSTWQKNSKFQAEISTGTFNDDKIILAKPLTFMNESGRAIQAIVAYYKLAPLDIIIIHDDLDLPIGKYKFQKDISSAGHNGIKSIIELLGTQMFHRVRIGIGKQDKEKQGKTENFVLHNFSIMEKLKLRPLKNQIIEQIKTLL